ncbi:MAG: acyloxyacyl hydrolase [Bacteroidales bacterium]|nr:acyloxyacyl hydrolase [Bacteroidales bacterium]
MKTKTNKITFKTAVSFILLMLISINTHANNKDSTTREIIHLIGVDLRPGHVFSTHVFFEGANNAQQKINSTLSGHLKYGFKFAPETRLGNIYPYAIQGIGVGYNTFFNSSELGEPLNIYIFQTSRIANITQNLSFDYEWNFGTSIGWKKYDKEKNPLNMVVGSNTNAYINLGFLLNWQISSNTNLRGGVGVTHYSNGNTSYPNSGVNTIGASVGVTRFFGNNEKSAYPYRPTQNYLFNTYINYDLIVYGATRKKGVFPENSNPMLVPGSFGVAGLNFNPLYNFSKYFRAGASLDLQYDESANIGKHIANDYIPEPENLKFYRPSFREQFSAGISLRAEIVMPIFSINLGVGKNFLCKGDDTNSFYQTFVLKTNITDNLFLHTGYQLYRFKDPNNLMLGLGYRFNAK